MARYSLYMSTLGNRPDLFPESAIWGNTSQTRPLTMTCRRNIWTMKPCGHGRGGEIPGLSYVWGGSSPSTSFDCSGFVSWVINHSGWNVGRLGAQGSITSALYQQPETWRSGVLCRHL